MAFQRLVIAATILVFAARPTLGQNDQSEPRVVVAKSDSPAATFSSRPANGNQFHALPENAELYSGDLLVSLPAVD